STSARTDAGRRTPTHRSSTTATPQEAGGVPGVPTRPASCGVAVVLDRCVAVLRPASVRADVLGARRPLGVPRRGAGGELVLSPPQAAAVGDREHRAASHPPPQCPDPELPSTAGAGSLSRAAAGRDAHPEGELPLRAPRAVGRAGEKTGAVSGVTGSAAHSGPRMGRDTRASQPLAAARLASVSVPPCASAICRESASPIPEPSALVV